MISHRNVISNVMQATTYDSISRKALQQKFGNKTTRDVQLGLLPFNHIYALVLICNAGVYRGDRTIVLPKFEMTTYLESIHHYRIQTLYLVSPPRNCSGSRRPLFPLEQAIKLIRPGTADLDYDDKEQASMRQVRSRLSAEHLHRRGSDGSRNRRRP